MTDENGSYIDAHIYEVAERSKRGKRLLTWKRTSGTWKPIRRRIRSIFP